MEWHRVASSDANAAPLRPRSGTDSSRPPTSDPLVALPAGGRHVSGRLRGNLRGRLAMAQRITDVIPRTGPAHTRLLQRGDVRKSQRPAGPRRQQRDRARGDRGVRKPGGQGNRRMPEQEAGRLLGFGCGPQLGRYDSIRSANSLRSRGGSTTPRAVPTRVIRLRSRRSRPASADSPRRDGVRARSCRPPRRAPTRAGADPLRGTRLL